MGVFEIGFSAWLLVLGLINGTQNDRCPEPSGSGHLWSSDHSALGLVRSGSIATPGPIVEAAVTFLM